MSCPERGLVRGSPQDPQTRAAENPCIGDDRPERNEPEAEATAYRPEARRGGRPGDRDFCRLVAHFRFTLMLPPGIKVERGQAAPEESPNDPDPHPQDL